MLVFAQTVTYSKIYNIQLVRIPTLAVNEDSYNYRSQNKDIS